MRNHSLEKKFILSSSLSMIILLVIFVPRTKIRNGLISFLFHQVITWFFGLLVVEKGLLTYPYRWFFKKSNRSSFLFEYFIFPGIAVLFNLYYPEHRHIFKKGIYYFIYSGIITFLEFIALKYTDLVRYKNWAWYWTFLTIGVSFFLSHTFYRWFIKKPPFQTTLSLKPF